MSVGEKIRQIRIKQKISQYELAYKTKSKLNQSQISKIEKGSRKVTDKDLFIFAKALAVPVEELIKK